MSISAFYERSRISLEHGLHANTVGEGVEPNGDGTAASIHRSSTLEGFVSTSSKDDIAFDMEQSSSRSFEKSGRSTDTQTKHTTDHAWAVEPNVVTGEFLGPVDLTRF